MRFATCCFGYGRVETSGRGEPAAELRGVDETRLLHHDAPVLQHDEVRDALHAVARRERGRALRVDLQDDRLAGHLLRDPRDLGRGAPAGRAPCGPEVDEHRDGRLADDLVECRLVGVDRLRDRRERHLAAAATALVGDRKSTRLNSSHSSISYAVFCLKKKKINRNNIKIINKLIKNDKKSRRLQIKRRSRYNHVYKYKINESG